MIMTEFIKKNKWNIIVVLVLSIACVYDAYNKSVIGFTSSMLCVIIWLSCLNKKYAYLAGIALIAYAIFILIIRADLWPGAVACVVLGLLILFFYRKKSKNG